MILKGQKRKLDPEDAEVSDRSSPLWDTQRQFVFSVSLDKYQRGQELPEPSLRRSVLIANTLRQIALEKCGAPPADEAEAAPPSSGAFRLQEEERENIAGESAVAAAGDQDEDWGSMSTESDFSLSAAISSILTALDSTVDGGPQAAPRAPLGSLENLPSLSDRGSAAAVKPSCPSTVAAEDPFQDVDTSLLERNMGGLGIRVGRHPAQEEHAFSSSPFSPSSSSHPFSLSLNSSRKCLPSFSSFSPLPSSPSPDSASLSGQNPAREAFELEHLMEILVES